jgi:hypothetical protein
MPGNADMPRESSTAEGSGVRAAVLRKSRRGKHKQSDCGPEHHGTILPPIELCFLSANPGAPLCSGPIAWRDGELNATSLT